MEDKKVIQAISRVILIFGAFCKLIPTLFLGSYAFRMFLLVLNQKGYYARQGWSYEELVLLLSFFFKGLVNDYTVTAFLSLIILPFLALIQVVLILYVLPAMVRDTYYAMRRAYTLKDTLTITADHGETLQEVVQGIRNEKFEYFAAFSREGQKLGECTSLNESGVCVGVYDDYDAITVPGSIAVHNHPNSSNPFSYNDISLALFEGYSRCIVVAKDMVYQIIMPDDAPDYEFTEIRKQCIRSWKKFSKFGYGLKTQIEFNELMAKEFGYEFRAMCVEDFLDACNNGTFLG